MTQPAASDRSFDPATFAKVRGALHELARTGDSGVVFINPVLLSAQWQDVLRERQDEEPPQVRSILAQLGPATETFRKNKWELGRGPVDTFFVQVIQNQMTPKTALALAAGDDIGWRLSPFYVRRLSNLAEKWAHDGDWRRGALMSQLLHAALDARRGQLAIDQAEMDFIATIHWLDVATRAVQDLPDGRLFRDAAQRGERLADVLQSPGDYGYYPAAMLQSLGILYLDPYVGNRSNVDYDGQIEKWRQGFRQQLEAEGVSWDEATMSVPEPAPALARAAGYLARAAEHREGEQRGWSLKAQVQALVWQRVAGGSPPDGEAERVGKEAQRLLDKPEHLGVRTEIDSMLGWRARQSGDAAPVAAITADDIAALREKPVEHWLGLMLPDEVIELYTQSAAAIEDSDPHTAFELWSTVQDLGWAQVEARRTQFFQRALNILAHLAAAVLSSDDADALAAAVARLQSASLPPGERALALLGLAVGSTPTNEEAQGLEILEMARNADAAFASRHERLIGLLRASLLVGAGANQFEANRFDDAAPLYMAAARAYLACDGPAAAWRVVNRVTDLVDKGSDQALAHLIVGIEELAPPLEQQVPGAAERLQVFYRRAMARFVGRGGAQAIVLLLLVERAKGNSFSRALIGGTPLAWLESDAAKEMEARLDDLRRHPLDIAEPRAPAFDFETVLGAYSSPFEQVGGTTVDERLTNAMIAFDDAATRAQMAQGLAPQWLATDTAVQAALGPRSALLALYVGNTPDGSLALFLMLLTREKFELRVGQLPDMPANLIRLTVGDASLTATPFALRVAEIRRAVQADPLTRVVSAEGAVQLESAAVDLLGGGLRERLHELHAAGKDHLVVWAHGPFHFLPFHLLGLEDAPLADDWTVTSVPSLQLLDPARHRPASRTAFAAVGLDFPPGNARGLPALSGAEAEARQVADAMQAPAAVTGAAVSKAAVLDALRTSARVHIATHGELPVNAPAFQALYLGTGPDGDVLHAYEILRLDLRGVDLVTLSACETSLGRIDIGDNLRGFSANLLIAGVSTIVGTLWPVETTCAKVFFTRLYTELHGGATKGAAFRTAQLATRARFTKHRDWGAFYLSGAVD